MVSNVIRASYFDADTDTRVTVDIEQSDIESLLSAILAVRSGRGYSALELERGDGSSLTICTDGDRAALVWINSAGESLHSIGIAGGGPLVYDYFGSWSEAPASTQVSIADARRSVDAFICGAAPDTAGVTFAAD
jgi:hypothetical protein